MQVSLNVIGSGSIVFCLVAAVALSVSLSFTSANRHLSDLESYGSESLALCYENVVSDAVDLVRNIMQKKIDKTRTVVVSLLSQFRNMDNTIRQSFADRDGSERVEFYRRLMPLLGAMWNHHDLAYLTVFDETYGVGFIEHSWRWSGDSRKPHPHGTFLAINEGNWTYYGTENGQGGFADAPCNRLVMFMGAGAGPCGKCAMPSSYWSKDSMPVREEQYWKLKDGETMWSNIVPFSTSTGVLLMSRIHQVYNSSVFTGLAFGLNAVSRALSLAASATERLFIVARDPSDRGYLVGVSHGEAVEKGSAIGLNNEPEPAAIRLHCTNASDPVIRDTSQNMQDYFESLPNDTRVQLENDIFHPVYDEQQKDAALVRISLLVNTTLSPVFLHSTNETVNEMEITDYFLEIVPFKDTAGISWWVVLLVERNTISYSIDAAEKKGSVKQATYFEEEEATKNSTFLFVIFVVLCLTLISAALTVVATMRMVGPLKELEKRMADVAKMRLEGATDLKNTYMTDLRSMQVSFRLMVAALEEYRQFLPASLLARNDTAEIIMTEDAADRRMDLDVMPSPESSPQDMSRNGRAKKYRLENSSSQNSSIAGSNAMPRANTFRNLMRVGLHMKTRVAEVLIGAHDFPQFLKAVLSNSDAAADVAGFLQKYMLGIVPEASAHHGSIVFFKADQVHVDFKGILPCSDVVGKAARFCCAVLANYRKHVNRHEQYFANAHVSLHVGAALVTAFVGNMGTPAMKGIQVIGEGVRLASIMQTVASEMRLGLVANAPFCARLPQLEYTTGPADCVVVESMVYLASAVIEQPRSGAPNWMYRPVQTVDTSFTTAWNFIYAGRLPEGTEKLAHVSLDSDYASLAGQVVKRLTLHRRETSLLGCKAVPQDTDLYRFSEPQLSGDTSPLSSPAASAAFFLLGTCTSQQGLNDSGVLEELETPIFSSGAQALSASAYHRYYVEACTVPSQLADLHDRALDLDQPLESALSSPRTATPRGSSTNMRNGIKRLRIGRGVGSPRLVSNRSQSQSSGTASLASQSSLRVASPCRE